jgi:benzoyl-CoA 2,3-dioxygenase component B
MFVGETGIGRIVQRTAELMREHNTADVRPFGAIDLDTIQRYLNFHFSVSVDLFGSEISTNAANYYTMGLKGRYEETKLGDDHQLKEATYPVTVLEGDRFVEKAEPALQAVNERLRDDYITDCDRGVQRWNKVLADHGIDYRLKLPHRVFNRQIGSFANLPATPDGALIDSEQWAGRKREWLPTEEDHAFIASLMQPVMAPGKFAGWIAPPARGIHGQPIDFEYVRAG